MHPLKWVGLGLLAIGAMDLLLGDTGHSPLPDAITNQLTQQTDLALIAGGAGLFFFVK